MFVLLTSEADVGFFFKGSQRRSAAQTLNLWTMMHGIFLSSINLTLMLFQFIRKTMQTGNVI